MKNKRFRLRSVMALAVATTVMLAGCSQAGPANQGGGDNGGGGSSDKMRVAFIPQLIGIPYFTAMEQGGEKAAEDLDVEFIYSGSTQANASEQSRILDSLIRQNVDAVSISVLDSSSINPVIRRAKQQGINIFTSDSDSPTSDREIFVAQALDQELGYTIIDRLAEQIGGDGQIGIISGESTATNLNNWIDFMEERIAEQYPDMEVVDIRYTQGGSSEQALTQAQELMTRYPDLEGLVAVASSTVPGVAQAVQQSGKTGDIAVIGFGSPMTVKPFIESGVMKESILWDAFDLGYLTVWAGIQLAAGEQFQEVNEVPGLAEPVRYLEDEKILLLGPPLVINADNVNDFEF